ncbi:MAG: carbon-phosphorus lyase complex subunit PhnJ, partial [Chloroflexota bacterium]
CVCRATEAVNKFMNEIPQDDGTSEFELSDSGYMEKLLSLMQGDDDVSVGDTYYDDEGNFYHDGYLKTKR